MNNVRTDFVPILINVVHVKIFGDRAVQLNRDHRILFAVDIFRLNVNFGPIESRFAVRLHKRHLLLLQHTPQRILGGLPVRIVAQIFLLIRRIPFGETERDVPRKAERIQNMIGQIQTALQLLLRLIRADDKVPLRDCKLAHARQPVHLPGIFSAKQRGSLPHAVGQIPV